MAKTEHTQVRFMSWERAADGLFISPDGATFFPVDAPAYEFGAEVKIPVNTPLRLFEKSDSVETGYALVGEASLPPLCESSQAYLIREKDRDGFRQYRIIALSNDPTDFPPGQVRVFNFTPYQALIKTGEEVAPLPPLSWKSLSVTPDRKHRVSIMASFDLSGEWTRAVQGILTIREHYRGNVTLLYTQANLDGIAPQSPLDESRMLIQTASEYIQPRYVSEALSSQVDDRIR